MAKLTDAVIRRAKPKTYAYKLTDSERRGRGRLLCRIEPNGAKDFYYRYRAQGVDRLIKIGRYDPDGRTGSFTLGQAIEQTRVLSKRLQKTPDLKEAIAIEARHEQAQRRAELLCVQVSDQQTLRALLAMYIDYLRRAKKGSAGDAENIFTNHVLDAFPTLAASAAANVQARDVAMVMRRLIDAGKERTAGKLRSYMAAAYALALRAETDPKAPGEALAFRLPANPASATKAHSGVKARTRTLTEAELRQFMTHITSVGDAQRDAVGLLLLLAGQRPAQLLRVKTVNVDLAGRRITLLDPKGKRTEPRLHVLPLHGTAFDLVSRRLAIADSLQSDWLFTTDGRSAMRIETLSALVKDISDAMVREKHSRTAFQLRDIRRTCETMLASIGVSRDVRAQLMSHGLSGVQVQHYDRHDYMREKATVLAAWVSRLEEIRNASEPRRGNVSPIRAVAYP